MRKILLALVAAVIVLGTAALGYVAWQTSRQGPSDAFWSTYKTAEVRFDAHGIPTLTAPDWASLTEAQGFVVASQRLFQMDLIRRSAGGRLAEFFGEVAYQHDEDVQREDRIGVAQAAAAALPKEERDSCEQYARGVNTFIHDFPGRWGLEYALLRVEPEAWTCADSLLVILSMIEKLTAHAEGVAQQQAWRRNLDPSWQALLFTNDHPWNTPLFGTPAGGVRFPSGGEALPMAPIGPEAYASVGPAEPVPIGSNNWVWRGATGVFVANDPHLGTGVPEIWYALRMKRAKDDWVVGVALPGLPGVILGMNPVLAWAFTNTGEDVDDYLKETLDGAGTKYLARHGAQGDEWRDVVVKTFEIKVKGEAAPRRVEARFTHRGPLAKRKYLADDDYARQWLALKPGMLRIPSMAFAKARSIKDFDAAIDGMRAPAQNVVMATYEGDIGYRVSGTGVERQVTGRLPQPADKGEWLGFEPQSKRRRVYYTAEPQAKTRFIATANERIWVDPLDANWFSDDRKERISRFLAAREDYARTDMEALQVDTEGRFRKLLLTWIAERAGPADGPAGVLAQRFKEWSGNSRSDPRVFAHATAAEAMLKKILLGRVQATFKSAADRQVPYLHYNDRAWLTALLTTPGDDAVRAFGLSSQELARFLLGNAVNVDGKLKPHQETNRWGGQHPFVGRVPLIGNLYKVDDFPQWGASDLVLAERPGWGPSMRLVWDLRQPWESTWTFPVGQSGHVLAEHYADFHKTWSTGERFKVFDDRSEFSFPAR